MTEHNQSLNDLRDAATSILFGAKPVGGDSQMSTIENWCIRNLANVLNTVNDIDVVSEPENGGDEPKLSDTLNDCRAEFEKWAIKNSGYPPSSYLVIPNGNYDSVGMMEMWREWQAAWNTRAEPARSEIPVINKPFGERLHPKVSKAYDKWVEANHDNPMIKGNWGFETFLAGWQTHEATKRETGALFDIAVERKRQIEKEDYSAEEDDRKYAGHHANEMSLAAASYCLSAASKVTPLLTEQKRFGEYSLKLWPWFMEYFKPKDERRDLVHNSMDHREKYERGELHVN